MALASSIDARLYKSANKTVGGSKMEVIKPSEIYFEEYLKACRASNMCSLKVIEKNKGHLIKSINDTEDFVYNVYHIALR